MEKQGKSRTLNFVKKSCRILSGILNWNVETSVKELGRLNEAHRSFAFVHLAVIVFTGLCSAGKYGMGDFPQGMRSRPGSEKRSGPSPKNRRTEYGQCWNIIEQDG
jgi:hypothetical protein